MGKPLVVITGPTGVGKSDFALQIAQLTGGHIINGDMAQQYVPLTIGTAKPAWRNCSIPHALFDTIATPRSSTASEYRDSVLSYLSKLDTAVCPVITGGTLFYIESLFNTSPLKPSASTSLPTQLRRALGPLCHPSIHPTGTRDERLIDAGGSCDERLALQPARHSFMRRPGSFSEVGWQQLFEIDAERARHIHPHDHFRINRALNIAETCNILPSMLKPVFNPVREEFIFVHLTRNRDDLYNRINSRVHEMFAAGWAEEVSALDSSWQHWLMDKKIIGYDTLIADMAAQSVRSTDYVPSLDCISKIQQRTRKYAKRQLTFWRSLSSKIELISPGSTMEINLTLCPVDLYLEKFFIAYERLLAEKKAIEKREICI